MVKRSCESATLPLASRFTFTTGKPGCSVQPAAISTTGLPEASLSAFHRCFLDDTNSPSRIAWHAFLQPDFPLRIKMSGAFRPHPGSEPFVEPEIVPPCHGDEITEPLVGDLVCDHFVNALFGAS